MLTFSCMILSPRRIILLLLVSAAGICGCREQLIHNLSEQQANRLITRLHDSDIKAGKKRQADDRWIVEVESEDMPPAMHEMQNLRLIREIVPDSSGGTSVVSSRDQQRFAFERALSAEIEQTLSSIEGVLEARSHLNLPQVDPLFGKIVPGAHGSGSVFLVAESSFSFSYEQVAALVAGASGIPVENISVLIELQPPRKTEVVKELPQTEAFIADGNSMAAALQIPNLTRYLAPAVGMALAALGCVMLFRMMFSKTVRE